MYCPSLGKFTRLGVGIMARYEEAQARAWEKLAQAERLLKEYMTGNTFDEERLRHVEDRLHAACEELRALLSDLTLNSQL